MVFERHIGKRVTTTAPGHLVRGYLSRVHDRLATIVEDGTGAQWTVHHMDAHLEPDQPGDAKSGCESGGRDG